MIKKRPNLKLEMDDGSFKTIEDTGTMTTCRDVDYIYTTKDNERYIVPNYVWEELAWGYSVVARNVDNHDELYYVHWAERE